MSIKSEMDTWIEHGGKIIFFDFTSHEVLHPTE